MAKIKKKMKGGGKVGKKDVRSKETEEERQLRLKMERLKDDEARRKREEMNRKRLKDLQAREERLSKLNRLKVHDRWRKILRSVKVEDLRKEIDVVSQEHERQVDRKDAIIQMLDRYLDFDEEQYQRALRSHLRNVDALIDMQKGHLAQLDKDFVSEARSLEQEFVVEKDMISNKHREEKQQLLDSIAAMEAEFNEQTAVAKQEFQSQFDEIKNKNTEDYNVLKLTLQSTIDELERHFVQAHQNYLANTEARTKEFKTLTLKDRENAKTIETQMRKLNRLQESLNHWKTKMSGTVREYEERNKALREEKDTILTHFKALKAKMNKFREKEKKRVTELTMDARSCIQDLEKKMEMAERLLRLGEQCRKLETEQEKVLPFATPLEMGAPGLRKDLEEESRRELEKMAKDFESAEELLPGGFNPMDQDQEMPDGTAFDASFNPLAHFHTKFNKVLLNKLALDRELERLEQENQQLRGLLQQYLDGISVGEDLMERANPLVVVRQFT